MPVQGGIEFFGEFESEHNLGQNLYNNDQFKARLESFGYQKDMMGNRRGLFISPDIVRQKVLGMKPSVS